MKNIDSFVRDLTKVGSIPKSEVKRRILKLIAAAEERGYEKGRSDLEKEISEYEK